MSRERLWRRALDVLILGWVGLVVYATLSPFVFEIPELVRAHVFPAPVWRPPDGMVFRGTGLFSFGSPSPEVADAVTEAGAFFVSAEIRPAKREQSGPARILTYALSPRYQGFMLGQEGRDVVFRLADPTSDRSLSHGHVYTFAAELEADTWTEILVTVTPEEIQAFRDGRSIGRYPDPVFAPESWARGCRLVAGNTPNLEREWLGAIRALSVGVGAPDSGRRVFELSGEMPPPDGWRAASAPDVGTLAAPWLLRPFGEPAHRRWARTDWTLNALLLLPLGALLALRRLTALPIALTLLATSLFIEVTQIFLPARHTQTSDLVLNVAGGLLGALVAGGLAGRLSARTRSSSVDAARRGS